MSAATHAAGASFLGRAAQSTDASMRRGATLPFAGVWLNGRYPSGRVPFIDGNKFVKMLKEEVDQLRVKVLSSFHFDVLINV